MWIADYSSVVEEVRTGGMREKPMKKNDVPLLRYHCGEHMVVIHVWHVSSIDGRVDTFGVIVEVLDDI